MAISSKTSIHFDLPPSANGAQELLDTKAAAAHLALAPSTLNKMRVYGTGPAFYRLGSAIRYKRADLDAWRDRFRVSSTGEADANHPKRLLSGERS